MVNIQDHIIRQMKETSLNNTFLEYDFEQIQVDLIMSCPTMSWVSYELTCPVEITTHHRLDLEYFFSFFF